ncbi:hypothetical protein AGMMS49944_01930 [Spirochaetia bacterium]|nr:hypothetical protein AGMMS49944_01930 [Spirochaetia bacterium]
MVWNICEYKLNLSKNFSENYDNRLSLGITFAFGHSYIPQPPAPTPKPTPEPQFIHYRPTITAEELNAVKLAYQDTGREIERRGKSIEITNISERRAFINKYPESYNPAVTNARNTKLEWYDIETTSEKDIVALAKNEPNPYMKIRMIHDWVADIFAYDYDLADWMDANGQAQFTVASLLQRERGVCYEYSVLFYTLMTAVGIDTYLVGDIATPGKAHEFNLVIIDGVGYIIDTTWDSGNAVRYNRYTEFKRTKTKEWFMPSVPKSYKMRGW